MRQTAVRNDMVLTDPAVLWAGGEMGSLWSDSVFLFMTFSCRILIKTRVASGALVIPAVCTLSIFTAVYLQYSRNLLK